ncbi:hypothetical protein [Leifsonia aquatica]|uniref:hypothetical protein n=1 Tax=Leifsonia aquatica TaxID=144185 RepID=UPI00046AA894|nr:hypothetical protein [Leifsonia aquatica]
MSLFRKKRVQPAEPPTFTRTIFRSYEIPADRTPESFAFMVELLWGHVIDELWTDDANDVDDITEYAHEEFYDVRVIAKDGRVEERPCPEQH